MELRKDVVLGVLGGALSGVFLSHLYQKMTAKRHNSGSTWSTESRGGLFSLARILREHHIEDKASAEALMATLGPDEKPSPGSGLAIFPGSFNPPHNLHLEMVKAACEVSGVDALWLDMTMHRCSSSNEHTLATLIMISPHSTLTA